MNKTEYSKLESLLAEYANAEMDCVRAATRRRNAADAVHGFVRGCIDIREASAYQRGFEEGAAAPEVPTGTPSLLPEALLDAELPYPLGTPPITDHTLALPLTEKALANGTLHAKSVAPVRDCSCATCCTERALAGIMTNGPDGQPLAPIHDVSGGN